MAALPAVEEGERLDIKVDAVARDEVAPLFGRLTVVIEVKGSWNPGLWKEMEVQLCNRYLRTHSASDGIYLVGWFADGKVVHLKPHPEKRRVDSDQALGLLRAQATHLSQQHQVNIQAFVLDASIKRAFPPKAKTRSATTRLAKRRKKPARGKAARTKRKRGGQK